MDADNALARLSREVLEGMLCGLGATDVEPLQNIFWRLMVKCESTYVLLGEWLRDYEHRGT